MRSKSEQAKRQLRNPDGTFKYQGGRRTPDHDTLARYAAPQPTDLDEQELHRFLETRLDNVPLTDGDREQARLLLRDTHPIRRGESDDMPLFAAWAYSRNGWEGSEYAGREFDGIPFRFNHPDRLRDQVKTDLIYRAIDEEQAQAPDGILASYVAGTHELRLTDYDHTQWSFRQRSISEAEAAVLARKMNGDYELPDPEESSRFDRMEQSGDFSPIRLESDRDRERWTRLCMSKYNLDDDADYWKTHAYEHPETGFDPDILLDPDAADREPETRPRTALEIRDSVAESAAWKYGDDMYRGYDRQDD